MIESRRIIQEIYNSGSRVNADAYFSNLNSIRSKACGESVAPTFIGVEISRQLESFKRKKFSYAGALTVAANATADLFVMMPVISNYSIIGGALATAKGLRE